MVEYLFFGIAI